MEAESIKAQFRSSSRVVSNHEEDAVRVRSSCIFYFTENAVPVFNYLLCFYRLFLLADREDDHTQIPNRTQLGTVRADMTGQAGRRAAAAGRQGQSGRKHLIRLCPDGSVIQFKSSSMTEAL